MSDSLIFGNGYDQADLMIVGDYARKSDETTKQCLGGYYKSQLEQIFKLYNFNISQTYRTCIIKNYIKGLGIGGWKQDKKILQACFEIHELLPLGDYIDILIDEINTIKPQIILCLGEYALQTLTGKEGLKNFRGSVLPLAEDIKARLKDCPWEIKVVVTHHPAVLHNQEELQFLMRLDIKKAVDLTFMPNRGQKVDYHEIHISRGTHDTLRFLDLYPKDKFPEMTYDIETHYGFITCAGISFDGFRGLCIPLFGTKVYGEIEIARNMYILSQELNERQLINQNIGYDQRVSQRFGLMLPSIKWDTMLAAHTICPEFLKNLGFLTSIYTDMSYYKDEGHDFDPRRESYDVLYGYNAKDAISTFQIYKKQVEDLKEMEMLEFFENFVMKLYSNYYESDSIGIKIDLAKRNDLRAKYEALRDLKSMELEAITNCKINLDSPSQIGKFMEVNNFPILRHRVDSGFMIPNTDVDSLSKMLIMDPIDYRKCSLVYEQATRFISLILLIRRLKKVIEYINVGVHPWGRVHTSSRLSASTSGRSSGGKSPDQWPTWEYDKKGKLELNWKKLGQSFQTVTKHGFIVENDDGTIEEGIEEGIIGKDLREMYIPDDGWVLVEGDGSQAEARVCDVLGEDWASLEEYGKVDKHCAVAAAIFEPEFTYEDIFRMAKKEKSDEGIAMRNIGKHSKHAKNNGMEAFLFATKYIPEANFRVALKKATEILKKIDKKYPNIENVFHKQVENELRNRRELIAPKAFGLPCGRKRVFLKKIDKHYLNVAYSYLPQAAISDHTKAARLRISARIDKTKCYIVGENHDSITALVRRGYLRVYISIAKQELERPIDFRGCSLSRDIDLIIPAEFSIGRKSWGQMKELKMNKLRLVA